MKIHKTGKHKHPNRPEEPEEAHDRPEHRTFLRQAAGDGIVLLKNDAGLLPLGPRLNAIKQIAFIGPNANESVAAGGGYVCRTRFPQLLTKPQLCRA